jgi:hypothetical protein
MADELPAAVRAVIAGWAADTLATLLPAEIPPSLTRVARFTPGKRSRLGATALLQAVGVDARFRAAVAERAREASQMDPAGLAAVAHLLRLPDEENLMAAAREVAPIAASLVETASLRRAVRQLERDLAVVTAERDQIRAQLPSAAADPEVEKLRKRLREQGTRVRQAEMSAQSATDRSAAEVLTLRSEVSRLTIELGNWQDRARLAAARADRAQESLGRLRDQTGQHKATADRRLDLLLSTVEGAVSGLRREWDLVGGGADPADLGAGRLPGAGAGPGAVSQSTTQPSRLHGWLGLPAAHLIVDGYNVSKSGYPDLTLAQQRERLVRQLAALSSRTSAEVTVVFDGAAVAVPAPPGRGIRVLFSPPGVIADDVIRDLVAAEPFGRVVLVVSSDREVAEGVRRRGARTAGSDVLLGLLT